MTERIINCAVECVEGCILGSDCPHREYVAAASKFIEEKSMDQILQIAEASVQKRMAEAAERFASEPPQWVDPPS